MKKQSPEYLYNLLPVIYRQLDIAQGEPLRAFMDVIESEYRVLETDLDELYDNWFIETCDPWVVPYIADLLGIRGMASEKNFTTTQRSRVANTIAFRRRKGIVTILERALQDMTGWKAHAAEFFKQLSITQSLESVRLNRGRTTDVRDQKSAGESGTPFNSLAHTIDVRSLPIDPMEQLQSGEDLRESASLQGKFNLGNVGLFLWRLQSYPVTRATPKQIQPRCYSFSPLGGCWQPDGLELFPLFNQPLTETSIHEASSERSVPAVLSRSALKAELAAGPIKTGENGYFGDHPVLQVFTKTTTSPPLFESIPAENMVVRDLRHCRGQLVFELELKFGNILDQGGKVHETVRKQFKKHDLSLARDTCVRVCQPGNQWLISERFKDQNGEMKKRAYVASREGDRIEVYDESLFALFSMDLEYESALQEGQITSELRGRFVEHGISLSPDDQVANSAVAGQWSIANAAGAEQYIVISESGKLVVYDPSVKVAIDPQLGRLAFPSYAAPDDVRVSYSYGFSADIGGGPYERRQTLATVEPNTWQALVSIDNPVIPPRRGTVVCSSLTEALAKWAKSGRSGLIQIGDNGIYNLGTIDKQGTPTGFESVKLSSDQSLVIEAANGVAPCLKGGLSLTGNDSGARVQLSGLLMEGVVVIAGSLNLDIRHCTLKPHEPELAREVLESLDLASPVELTVTIEHSIVGRICLPGDTRSLTIQGSIVDSGSATSAISGLTTGDEPDGGCVITAAGSPGYFGPSTTLARSTIFGRVSVKELTAASDVIFRDQLNVQSRHVGSMRYSYVPAGSKTPLRYRCQPDLALQRIQDSSGPAIAEQTRPSFTAEVYGHPGYAQLGLRCPREIQTGAENGSEMGVFNHLYQPERRTDLGLALAEFLPFGQEAGIFYVN